MERMERRTEWISQSGFALLQEEVMRFENIGHGPDAAVHMACARIGFWPKDFTEVILVVDPALDGPIWPFMSWPQGWDREDKSTWK